MLAWLLGARVRVDEPPQRWARDALHKGALGDEVLEAPGVVCKVRRAHGKPFLREVPRRRKITTRAQRTRHSDRARPRCSGTAARKRLLRAAKRRVHFAAICMPMHVFDYLVPMVTSARDDGRAEELSAVRAVHNALHLAPRECLHVIVGSLHTRSPRAAACSRGRSAPSSSLLSRPLSRRIHSRVHAVDCTSNRCVAAATARTAYSLRSCQMQQSTTLRTRPTRSASRSGFQNALGVDGCRATRRPSALFIPPSSRALRPSSTRVRWRRCCTIRR